MPSDAEHEEFSNVDPCPVKPPNHSSIQILRQLSKGPKIQFELFEIGFTSFLDSVISFQNHNAFKSNEMF